MIAREERRACSGSITLYVPAYYVLFGTSCSITERLLLFCRRRTALLASVVGAGMREAKAQCW